MLFWTSFNPFSLSHISGSPKSTSHISKPLPQFLVVGLHTYISLCRGFVLVRDTFVGKILSGVVFDCAPSVRIHRPTLQHKAKQHFQFEVLYVWNFFKA